LLPNKVKGVIFDLDNTLVSSSLDFTNIRTLLGCPKGMDVLDFVDSLPEKEKLEGHQLLIDHEMTDVVNARKLPGTDELLSLLARLNIPCAIVTRNSNEAALSKIKNNGIDISLILTREDYKAKPAPDALLYLADYWQKPTANLLYVGDYLYDVQAAINAKTMSCLVTYGENLAYAELATLVVKNLNELSDIIDNVFTPETSCI